jgi:hypothetical protein
MRAAMSWPYFLYEAGGDHGIDAHGLQRIPSNKTKT